MIKVDIRTQDHKIKQIEISGHAYSGKPGFDLVCAGVSSIGVGALNAFDSLGDNCTLVLEEEPAYISISCPVASDNNQLMMNFLHQQLKTVEFVHSKHLKINVKEESQ